MNALKPLRIIGAASPEEKNPPLAPLYLTPVQAGWPSPADDYIDSEINLHELLVTNPPATFFLRAAGDSMIGCGIHDGDLLVVDRSREALHNRVVIAAVDGELLVKRLQRRGKRTWLAPANPDYPEIEITNLEYVHIWGVVTYVIHKFS
ncbi:MAG: translesion error-prone DNA polymerase V autoproteolytic subunit [Desulfovibrio sp.]|nr:translesion error-prone DNA polymerase V autoproteolytic subunit [Desulfovibrio sp.]